jgi:hypothetical protein
VVSGDGGDTAAADPGDAGSLGLDAAARLRVVDARNEPLVTRAHLKSHGALARLRNELVRVEAVADLGVEPEPVEPSRPEHDRVEPSLATLAQARVHVAAQRLDREARLEREELSPPAHGGRTDPHSEPQPLGPAERVPRIAALQVRANGEPARQSRGHVLRRVDRDVDAALEQRFFDLLDEDAARADLAERTPAVAVAGRRDRNESDVELRPRLAKKVRGDLGLRQREPATAAAEPNEHC